MRWSKVKIDLNELAKLRWIKKLTIPEICKELNRSRVHIRRSIRTLRNSGISQLNLTDLEKIQIKTAMVLEIKNSVKPKGLKKTTEGFNDGSN